jgi:hypothetical protein
MTTLVSTAYKASLLLPNGFAKKIELFLSTLNFSHIWENQKTFSKRRLFHATIDKKLNEGYLHYNNIFIQV